MHTVGADSARADYRLPCANVCASYSSYFISMPLQVSAGLSTDKVWSQDYGMMCYQGEHLALALGLGLPGLLIFGVGELTRARETLHDGARYMLYCK